MRMDSPFSVLQRLTLELTVNPFSSRKTRFRHCLTALIITTATINSSLLLHGICDCSKAILLDHLFMMRFICKQVRDFNHALGAHRSQSKSLHWAFEKRARSRRQPEQLIGVAISFDHSNWGTTEEEQICLLFLWIIRERKYVFRTLHTDTYLTPINTTVAL